MSIMDQRNGQPNLNNKINDYSPDMTQMHTVALYKLQHLRHLDCFTIALGKKTGTTFPIDLQNQTYNALYDTGAGCSLISYSTYETLGIDLGKGYQPEVKTATGENMGTLGQVTCTFTINNASFTQPFIVCRNMSRPVILSTDFTAMNFIGVIWTHEGTQTMMHANGTTVIELPDSTTGVPLLLA